MLSSRLARLRKPSLAAQQVTLATGNQSGDLDSVVSAIVHSFFNNLYNDTITVPFLNFHKKDLRLREDVVLCLQRARIDPDLLLFIDDLSPTFVKQHGVTDVCLLDHNVPQGSIAKLISENPDLKVSGIIDHHEDERKYLDASPRVISRSGSCSSLVWDFWKEKVDSSKGDTTANGIQDAVTLLSAALVLDTSNCTSKMEKFDWDASESYKKISADDAVTASSFDAWFQQLQDARNDIGDLNIKEILTKDYKFFDFQVGTSESSLRLGISSMIKSFEWLLEQQEKPALDVFRKEALTFISSNDIDALLIMCAFTNPLTNSFERQLVFITNTVETSILLRLVIDSITEELKLETIQLEEIQDDQLPMVKFFNQRNVKGSRKLVAPVIKAALNAL